MQSYDIYELMIIPPNKKGEMIVRELEKPEPNLNLVRDLITLGANFDWQNDDGNTALHFCAIHNRPEISGLLISVGADLNIQDIYGRTALHWCARDNRPEIARVLLDAGADMNMLNEDGMSALHLCARFDHPEIARMLINAGADMNICGIKMENSPTSL